MTYEEFQADEKTQYALIRAIEIIGEASKKNLKRNKRTIRRNTLERNQWNERYPNP